MVDSDFDYTLMIEFERLSIEELKYTLQILSHSSSSSYIDIEHLADEVICRLNDYRYSIREKYNQNFNQLVVSTFETLKNISRFMVEPSPRIQIIYDVYRKYMHGIESPVTSPVVSPKTEGVEQVKAPKIMKKVKEYRKEPSKSSGIVRLPKIMKKAKKVGDN
jgi:hypothetical protein